MAAAAGGGLDPYKHKARRRGQAGDCRRPRHPRWRPCAPDHCRTTRLSVVEPCACSSGLVSAQSITAHSFLRIIRVADDDRLSTMQPLGIRVGMERVTAMREPKFSVGQAVAYFPPRGLSAERGAYRVVAELPLRSGQFAYRIKHPCEERDRVATEDDLSVLWN